MDAYVYILVIKLHGHRNVGRHEKRTEDFNECSMMTLQPSLPSFPGPSLAVWVSVPYEKQREQKHGRGRPVCTMSALQYEDETRKREKQNKIERRSFG